MELTLSAAKQYAARIGCFLRDKFVGGDETAESVRSLLLHVMTISALITGFGTTMSLSVSNEDIRTYAAWNKEEFFGKHSKFCEHEVPYRLEGAVHWNGRWQCRLEGAIGECKPPLLAQSKKDGQCSADGCWTGNWQTQQVAIDLQQEVCSMTFDELRAFNSEYVESLVRYKEASVHMELGANTMFIIWATVFVCLVGMLLLISLSKHSESSEWVRMFSWVVTLMCCVPLFLFYNFLALASRVVKTKFYFCDDFI